MQGGGAGVVRAEGLGIMEVLTRGGVTGTKGSDSDANTDADSNDEADDGGGVGGARWVEGAFGATLLGGGLFLVVSLLLCCCCCCSSSGCSWSLRCSASFFCW